MKRRDDSADYDNFQSTYGMLLFGVPNRGMDISSLIPMAQDQVNLPFLMSLGKESSVLRDLHRDFCDHFDYRDSLVMSYYETELSPTAKQVSIAWSISKTLR